MTEDLGECRLSRRLGTRTRRSRDSEKYDLYPRFSAQFRTYITLGEEDDSAEESETLAPRDAALRRSVIGRRVASKRVREQSEPWLRRPGQFMVHPTLVPGEFVISVKGKVSTNLLANVSH